MSLTALYERFLASPNPLSLADNAALHYIPTLTTHSQPGPIIRHLENQNKNVVTTKSAKKISAIEGQNALSIEVDTTLEFISGGGAYLPGLENFVADKFATLPVTHIVLFNADQKISQIRMSWDQASLLLQTDIIGSRGRNWPVVDGKDQIRLIVSSKAEAPTPTPASPTSPRGRGMNENGSGFAARNPSPNKKHIKDPYASLDLFGPQRTDEGQSSSYSASQVIAPRASAKPPPREMSELFAAGHEDLEEKPGSPKKSYAEPALAPKGAGSQKWGAVRVFEQDENDPLPKIYKTNPARYNHFDLGDNDEEDPMQYRPTSKPQPLSDIPMRAKTDKHGSQWDFSDFVTPAKVPMKTRAQDKVNIDWGDDNQATPTHQGQAQKPRRDQEAHFELKDDGTPAARHAVPKPRKDADTHFAFDDQPTPAARRIIARTDAAKGLYRDVLHDEDEKPPLSSVSANARKHDFGAHWEMTDEASAEKRGENKAKGVSENLKKASQMMEANWESYDQSPNTAKRPSSKGQTRAMETHWSMGDEDEQTKRMDKATAAGTGGKKGFWDF